MAKYGNNLTEQNIKHWNRCHFDRRGERGKNEQFSAKTDIEHHIMILFSLNPTNNGYWRSKW